MVLSGIGQKMVHRINAIMHLRMHMKIREKRILSAECHERVTHSTV